MELDVADCVCVISENLVGQGGEVEVVPLHLLIKGSDQHIVPARMDCNGGDPLGSTLQLPSHFLLHQVVDPDMALGRDEEVRPDRVEEDALHLALRL